MESELPARVRETHHLREEEILGWGLLLVQERRPGEVRTVPRERSYPSRTNDLQRLYW